MCAKFYIVHKTRKLCAISALTGKQTPQIVNFFRSLESYRILPKTKNNHGSLILYVSFVLKVQHIKLKRSSFLNVHTVIFIYRCQKQ